MNPISSSCSIPGQRRATSHPPARARVRRSASGAAPLDRRLSSVSLNYAAATRDGMEEGRTRGAMAGRQAGNGRAGKQTGADATAGSNGLGATFVGTLRNARCVVCHGHGRGRGRRALCRWCGLKVSIYRPSVGSGRAGQGRAGPVGSGSGIIPRAHTLLNVCLSVCLPAVSLSPLSVCDQEECWKMRAKLHSHL